MQFRIVSGNNLKIKILLNKNLITVYKDKNLIVEASHNKVKTFKNSKKLIICFGDVTGSINNDGRLVKINSFEVTWTSSFSILQDN